MVKASDSESGDLRVQVPQGVLFGCFVNYISIHSYFLQDLEMAMIEVIVNDRLGTKTRVKCR